MTLWLIIGILALALTGIPLFCVLALGTLLAFHYAEIDSAALIIEMYRIVNAPGLIAIPLFTFAGFILAESEAPKRITRFSKSLLGGFPGGIPTLTLCVSAFFTAFTGASGVTIIALGGLLLPLLLKESYGEKFSLGLLTTSGSLGLLFPPSLPLIIYGLIAKVSIDRLFLAGILPGFFLILIFAVYSWMQGKNRKIPSEAFSLSEVLTAGQEAIFEIPLPFLILIGIYGGFITVSEAASVTVVYVLIVECVIHRDIHWKNDLPQIMMDSSVLFGTILIILGSAMGFTGYLVDEEVPNKLFSFIREYIESPYTFLIALNLFLLIVGCLMDIFSAIIIVVPLILPVALSYGVDPTHLGVVILTNLEIGYFTPPVGINLFIASSRFKTPVTKIYRSTLPFFLLMLGALILITYFPIISLWIPGLFS